jgi:anti-sigma B factor antagonist
MPTPGGHHWLDREDVNDVTVVRFRPARLSGEDTSRDVFGLLYGLVGEAGRTRLVLNFGRVQSLDSHAVGQLVLLNRKAQAAGGGVALCGLGPGLHSVFQSMHLTGTFAIYADEAAALASFPPAGAAPEADSSGG